MATWQEPRSTKDATETRSSGGAGSILSWSLVRVQHLPNTSTSDFRPQSRETRNVGCYSSCVPWSTPSPQLNLHQTHVCPPMFFSSTPAPPTSSLQAPPCWLWQDE